MQDRKETISEFDIEVLAAVIEFVVRLYCK